MSATARVVLLSEVIEGRSVGRLQVQVIGLCALVAMLDGFDTQLIAFVAPAIARTWDFPIASFGVVFSAGLLGLMFGAAALGSLADRIGRKKVIVLSTAVFGSFAVLTAFAESLLALALLRFATGIGLGGAMPNIIALSAEYAPKRVRGTLITLMFCGFPLGAVIGGPISSYLISSFGWQAVFIVGGVAPLALLPLLIWKLPESLTFLAQTTSGARRLAAMLKRFRLRDGRDEEVQYVADEEPAQASPLKCLFTEQRTALTLLLWLVFFSNLLVLYWLINWLPVILQRAGFALDEAIRGTVLLNAGGIVGGLLLGRLIDWQGHYRILASAYFGGSVFVALTGYLGGSVAMTSVLVFLSGFCVIGGQFGANGLAASIYPTAARSTGVGWALGVGRVGAIVGPLLGSLVIAREWPVEHVFLAGAVPAAAAAAAVVLMMWTKAPRLTWSAERP